MTTSRERVLQALNHEEADRVPLDLGGSFVTSMHVTVVYRLRQALGLDEPGRPVKVVEPYQMLGEIEPDLMDALGVDVVGLSGEGTMFGYRQEGWKAWAFWDGTPLLVPEGFNTDPEPDGSLLQYPDGDKTAPPSGRMPKEGFYFDAIIRQEPVDDESLRVEDNLEEFGPVSREKLDYFAREAKRLFEETDKAILANFGGTAFGDIALVPAPWLKHPRGIRDVAEWYLSLAARPDYIRELFERQCEIALANLARFHESVGDRVAAVFLTGTDFGAQQGPCIAPDTYRTLFKPFHKRLNDWVHEHTQWKTFIHSCGSVYAFIPDFIEAGFDILNPVQCSAADMEPRRLKEAFGDRITFWGGGAETQRSLAFGTPEEVRAEVRDRVRAFGPGGGFVFNTVHNVQPKTPVENVLAMYETLRDCGRYPLCT